MIDEAFTKTYAPWVALFALVFGAIKLFWDASVEDRRQRVERTFDLIKEYRASEMIQLRLDFMYAYEDRVEARVEADGASLPPEGKQKLERSLVEEFLVDKSVNDRFERLLLFYDTVATCANYDRCDGQTAEAFFGDDMAAFRNNFLDHFQMLWREKHRTDGQQIDIFFTKPSLLPRLRSPAASSAESP